MKSLWATLIICAAVGLVYGNSLDGGFHYDDFHSIVDNPHIRDLANIPHFFVDPQLFSADPAKAMYRPLLLVTYALNYALGGYSGTGFHLVNILLHMGCALLVRQIGLRVGLDGGAALGAALLFAVHPLASEPVNYISSRSEGLCAFFYLAAFWALLGQSRSGYLLGVACFVLALMTKSVAVSLPVVVLLWQRWGARRPLDWRHWALFGVAAAYVALLLGLRFLAPAVAGAPRGMGQQLWTQIKALGYYVKLVVMPVGLNVEHQFFVSLVPFSLAVLATGLAPRIGGSGLLGFGYAPPALLAGLAFGDFGPDQFGAAQCAG